MAEYTANFEAGTLDATIAAADPGSATAWNAVTIGAGAALTYSDDQKRGSLAAHITTGVGTATSYLEWNGKTFGSEHYGRFYIYKAAALGARALLSARSTNGNASLATDASDHLRVRDSGDVVRATSTNALPLNAWSRIEYRIKEANSPDGEMEARLFLGANVDGATPDEVISFTGQDTLNAAPSTTIRIGMLSSAAGMDLYLDDIVTNATTWPGPALLLERTFKRLYGPALLTGAAADLYTVPTGARAKILSILASNPSAGAVDFTLSIGADGSATRLYDGFSLAADSVTRRNATYDLAAGEKIQGYAGSAGTVVLTVTGWEEPT